MPLQTACSACAAKIKVKDELVGKSVKCPKCGKIFKALAGDAAVNANGEVAPKSKAKKPPATPWDADDNEGDDDQRPAWDKKSDEDDDDPEAKNPGKQGPPPKKRAAVDEDDNDDISNKDGDQPFEELLERTTLAPLAKKQIAGEIGLREKACWIGQPDPKIMTVRSIPKALGGVFILTFLAIFGSIFGSMQFAGGTAAIVIGCIVVVWFLLALIVTGLVLYMERRKAIGSAYVITNKRCITFVPGWFSGPAPTSYYPDLVQHMRRMPSWIFGGDAGDIVFRSLTTVTTTYHRRGGASTSVRTTYYGFLGIRNLDEVEGRIRQARLRDDDDDDDEEEEDRRKKKGKAKKRKRRDDD